MRNLLDRINIFVIRIRKWLNIKFAAANSVKTVALLKKAGGFFAAHRIALIGLVTVAILLTSCTFSGVVLGYRVIFNGQRIGTVLSKNEYKEALTIADNLLSCGDLDDYAEEPELSSNLVFKSDISNVSDIAYGIVDNIDGISKGSEISLGDTVLGYLGGENRLSEISDEYLNGFAVEGEDCVCYYAEDVKITDGYYPDSILNTEEELREIIGSLDVYTSVTTVTSYVIPYETVYRESSTRTMGDFAVAVNGVEGVGKTTEKAVYLNGEKISSDVISSETVTEPVDKIVVVGTAKNDNYVSSATATRLGFICPLNSYTITSYWGDGRGHKGVDLATKSGTPIFAAQSGTVISSSYNGNYGNCIIIDHHNGYKTVYAHCSVLYAKVGDEVAQGSPIALVGSTGQSTGPHLHFEVRYNDVQQDPSGYINLR